MSGQAVTGVEEVQRNMKKLAKRFGDATVKSAVEFGEVVRAAAIESIQDVSNGATETRYRSGGNSYEHVVSSEGDAPNTDTGRLVSSIQVEVTPKEVFVGSSLDYAGHLENGTKNMRARPWLYPALENNRDKALRIFSDDIRKVIRRGV